MPMKVNKVITEDDIGDLSVEITVQLAKTKYLIGDMLKLGQGKVIELDKLAGEPLDILVNGVPFAQGEVVSIGIKGELPSPGDKYGIRITKFLRKEDKLGLK